MTKNRDFGHVRRPIVGIRVDEPLARSLEEEQSAFSHLEDLNLVYKFLGTYTNK